MSNIKKTATQVQTEELLNLLDEDNTSDEVNYTEYKNDILQFISVFNLKPGEEYIKAFTLYSIYKVWSKTPISKTAFYSEICKYFESLNGKGYKINRNAIQLTHEAYVKFEKKKIRLKSKYWTKHFEDFILYYSIKNGSFWLEDEILYFLYDKYTYERNILNTNRLSKELFFTYADLFFKHKITKTGKVYSVTDNITVLFQQGQLQRMQSSYAEEKKKAKPKKSTRKP